MIKRKKKRDDRPNRWKRIEANKQSIPKEEFTRDWSDDTVSRLEIAKKFGVPVDFVTIHARRLGLPPRKSGYRRGLYRREFDPTPDEIKKRAKAIRLGLDGHPGWTAEEEEARRVYKLRPVRPLCVHQEDSSGQFGTEVFADGGLPAWVECDLTPTKQVYRARRQQEAAARKDNHQ